MKGRSKANRENMIILAHQTASFSRAERLKPVERYLKTASSKPSGTDPGVFTALSNAASKGLVTIRERAK